jgi:hypothetical protein
MEFIITQPFFAVKDNSRINCTWDHPSCGPIPFTASPDDVESYGQEIYAEALAGEYGPVISYEDSHWYSLINDNEWNGQTYNIGQLMVSPTGVQPPNSTNQPIPPAPEQ